jgi:3-dehydroquinate dehydratase-2
MLNILVLHGPNLNMLGIREPEVYGRQSLADINQMLEFAGEGLGASIRAEQSNHEGRLIDLIHEAMSWADGIIINPGAYTHYSYAIRDAIDACGLPCVEVHISDIQNREDFRKISVISEVCVGTISGLGSDSYRVGLETLVKEIHSGRV